MRSLLRIIAVTLAICLGACASTPEIEKRELPKSPTSSQNEEHDDIPSPEPVIPETNSETNKERGGLGGDDIEPLVNANDFPDESINDFEIVKVAEAYTHLEGWKDADMRGTLKAFQRGCERISNYESDRLMFQSRTTPRRYNMFGTALDWQEACDLSQVIPTDDLEQARMFFENEFLPIDLSVKPTGMVTGYYQPTIYVRSKADDIYSEPILGIPEDKAVLSWPRSKITDSVAPVFAYGKPVEVFFMQIQGSGVMVFPDGQQIRAAYGQSNGKPYRSIGRILIQRGELTKEQASKESIETWMEKAGGKRTRELMNQNPRYIFFKPEKIKKEEGPKGAMGVPLTDMVSIAIDPSYYPYGLPVWLETTIPQKKGDYKGQLTQILTITQDTGKAIRGKYRADLYFGSGNLAGEKAGVMKHPARWTILLPIHLALALQAMS